MRINGDVVSHLQAQAGVVVHLPSQTLISVIPSSLESIVQQDPAYVERFKSVAKGLKSFIDRIADEKKAIAELATKLNNAKTFRGRDYDPLIDDFAPFTPYDDILDMTIGHAEEYTIALLSVVETLCEPSSQIESMDAFESGLSVLRKKETPFVVREDGKHITLEEIFQKTGITDVLDGYNDLLVTGLYHPRIKSLFDVVEQGLEVILARNQMKKRILGSGHQAFARTLEFFGPANKQYWDIAEQNPLLTQLAIQTFSMYKYRPLKPGFTIPLHERRTFEHTVAQLTDPQYAQMLVDFNTAIRVASENISAVENMSKVLEQPFRDLLKRWYALEGRTFSPHLEKNNSVDITGRLEEEIRFEMIGADTTRKVELSSSQRRIVEIANNGVKDAVALLKKMAGTDSYRRRMETAGKLLSLIHDTKKQMADLAYGQRKNATDGDMKHFVLNGNIFKREFSIENVVDTEHTFETLVPGPLIPFTEHIDRGFQTDAHAHLYRAFFANTSPIRPFAMVGPRGSGKTTLLRAVGGQTNSLYLDFSQIVDVDDPQKATAFLQTQLSKLQTVLRQYNKPTYILIDNLFSQNQLPGTDEENRLVVSSKSMDDQIVPMVEWVCAVARNPMLRLIVATQEPGVLFKKIHVSKVSAVYDADRTMGVKHLDALYATSPRQHSRSDEDQQHVSLGQYFDVGVLGLLSGTEAAELLRSRIQRRLPISKNVHWVAVGNRLKDVPGTTVCMIEQGIYKHVFDAVIHDDDSSLANKLSEHFAIEGTTDASWQKALQMLGERHWVSQNIINQQIDAAKATDPNIESATAFVRALQERYDLRPRSVTYDGAVIGRKKN